MLYARAKCAVTAWGMGLTHHLNGVDNVEYLANLALLCGHVGKVGAGLLPLRGHSNVQGIGTIGVKPVLAADVLAKMEAAFGVTLPRDNGFDTMAGMKAAERGEIDVALLMGGNLYEANPHQELVARGVREDRLQALSHHDAQSRPRARRRWRRSAGAARHRARRGMAADHAGEHVQLRALVGRRDKPAGERTPGSVDSHRNRAPPAAQLPIDFATFQQHKTIREAIARIVPGMEELADIDVAKREFHVRGRLMHTPRFNTGDGKAHLVVRATPEPAPAGLMLTTVRSEGQFNTIIYERTDTYRNKADRWTVMANAEDLAANGLSDGDTADVISAFGAMRGVTVRAFDIARGAVMAYFPEANALTGTEVDPRSKTPAFKATPVRLVKV